MSSEKSSFFKKINQDHIDALQELGNIGSGHAANALADLLNRRVDMSLPRFSILGTSELSTVKWRNKSPEALFVVVITETTGDVLFNIVNIFDEDTAQGLLDIINPTEKAFDLFNLSSLEKSILIETGHILSLHFLTAMNEFLGTKCFPSIPNFAIETSETVLTSIATQSSFDFSHLILIECDIFSMETKLSPLVILIPDEKTAETTIQMLFGG